MVGSYETDRLGKANLSRLIVSSRLLSYRSVSTYEQTRRPHSGRRRNEKTRQAILDAALALLADPGGVNFTMESVAGAAGAGKQTLYRWWPSKAALLADVMAEKAASEVPIPHTETLQGDLTAFFSATFRAARDRAIARALRTIMAEAQSDAQPAEVLTLYTSGRRRALHELFGRSRQRGEIDSDMDIEILVDQAFGFIWYRLLVGHSPLTARAASKLAAGLARQAQNSSAPHPSPRSEPSASVPCI
jgi:AcrR family transcriptional regulator